MVTVFQEDLRESNRKSSKGNQLKWENNGVWYKADHLGYEGLSECVVSELLKKSSLEPSEYVLYEPEEIQYKTQTFKGCRSLDFSDGWQVITLERLFKNRFGEGLNTGIYSIEDHKERLRFLVNQVESVTGLNDFGKYICKLFTIDALFLNEDRHTHNVSVLMNDKGEFRMCPIYDNGAALMSDLLMDYPMGCDIYAEINNVKAKTICNDFDEQLDIAEELYGSQIKFHFTGKDIKMVLDKMRIYAPETRERVEILLLERRRKYKYLFV
jgi:hypothetical protein